MWPSGWLINGSILKSLSISHDVTKWMVGTRIYFKCLKYVTWCDRVDDWHNDLFENLYVYLMMWPSGWLTQWSILKFLSISHDVTKWMVDTSIYFKVFKYIPWCEAFHGKRDTYNCSIDTYISNKSRTLLIGHSEAIHGKRDTFERDIIVGGSLSFSPIVIFVVWICL